MAGIAQNGQKRLIFIVVPQVRTKNENEKKRVNKKKRKNRKKKTTTTTTREQINQRKIH